MREDIADGVHGPKANAEPTFGDAASRGSETRGWQAEGEKSVVMKRADQSVRT